MHEADKPLLSQPTAEELFALQQKQQLQTQLNTPHDRTIAKQRLKSEILGIKSNIKLSERDTDGADAASNTRTNQTNRTIEDKEIPPDYNHSDSDDNEILLKEHTFTPYLRKYVCVMLTNEVGSCSSIFWGYSFLLMGGVLVSLLFPLGSNMNLRGTVWPVISGIIGYTYFLAWSISFYPQALLNFQRRSTSGLSADYCLLNFFGHVCYCIYNSVLFWSPIVQQEYRNQHSGSNNLVETNDVSFSLHAVLLSGLILYQVWYYGDWKINPPSTYTNAVILLMTAIGAISAVFIGTGTTGEWLVLMYLLSLFKILITCTKCVPQMLLNFERKSTLGWNIWGILLDLVGGLLSTVQLFGDGINTGDVKNAFGNWAKLGLGVLSVVFDVVFMLQHYVLYPYTEKLDYYDTATAGISSSSTEDKDEDESIGFILT